MSDGHPQFGPFRVNWPMAGVVLALLVQTSGLIIWGAKIDQRVGVLEQKISASEKLSETVARMDERTLAMASTLEHMDARLSAEERGGGRRP